MKKQFLGFMVLILILILAVAGFQLFSTTAPVNDDNKLDITTSFYPLAEFARQVGGEFVNVTSITPTGVEPHDFEPTPQVLLNIYQSDLFIYNGGGVDAWASKFASGSPGIESLNISEFISTLLPALTQADAENPALEEERFDEHFWLSPKLAQQQVIIIRDRLISIDPEHSQTYRTNAELFFEQLAMLDQDYQTGLANCDLSVAVTSHAAFGYLARDYRFEQIPIAGLSPDEEPSAGDMAMIAKEAQARNVSYIFFETLVSPKLAQTLASEIGAKTLVFNPLEGLTDEERLQGKTYLSIMKDNLANLRTAMACR